MAMALCWSMQRLLSLLYAVRQGGIPVSKGDVEGGGGLAAGAVEAVGNRVGGAGRNVAQPHVCGHLPRLPGAAPQRQQPIQHLLEEPISPNLHITNQKYC